MRLGHGTFVDLWVCAHGGPFVYWACVLDNMSGKIEVCNVKALHAPSHLSFHLNCRIFPCSEQFSLTRIQLLHFSFLSNPSHTRV